MIVWSEEAKNDLQEIFDYISEDSPKNAEMVVRTFVKIADSLELFPYKFPKEPFIDDESVRFVPKWSFKLIYKILPDKIIILNIFHTSQNPEKLLRD